MPSLGTYTSPLLGSFSGPGERLPYELYKFKDAIFRLCINILPDKFVCVSSLKLFNSSSTDNALVKFGCCGLALWWFSVGVFLVKCIFGHNSGSYIIPAQSLPASGDFRRTMWPILHSNEPIRAPMILGPDLLPFEGLVGDGCGSS